MQKGQSDTDRTFSFFLRPESNRLSFRVSTTTLPNDGGDSSAALALNTWTHVALVKRGSTLSLYLDGTLDSQRSLSSPVVHNSLPLRLSAPQFGGTEMKLDDLRLYCHALSALQIQDLVSLVGYWRFAEGSGSTAQDSSACHNDGLLGGSDSAPAWVPVGADYALSFDGLNDVVQIPNSPSLELGKADANFSIAYWINLRQSFTGNWRLVMQKGQSDTDRTFSFFLRPESNRLSFRVSTTTLPNDGGDSSAALALNTWTHVALVKRGSTLSLYLDGTLDSQRSLSSPVVHNSLPLRLGSGSIASARAQLDELRLYDGALSPGLVAQLASTPYRLLNQSQPAPSPLPRTLALLPAGSTAPSATPSPALQASLHQGELRLRLPLPHNSPNPSLSLQSSPDLIHWQPLPIVAKPGRILLPDGGAGLEFRIPLAAGSPLFFRLTPQ